MMNGVTDVDSLDDEERRKGVDGRSREGRRDGGCIEEEEGTGITKMKVEKAWEKGK